MKVKVYRNLNRKGVWYSVACVKTGLVLAHATHMLLRDVEFKVSQTGRERVLKEKRKNVHAYVVGDLQTWSGESFKGRTLPNKDTLCGDAATISCGVPVTYDPYRNKNFVTLATGNPIFRKPYCEFSQDGVYIA